MIRREGKPSLLFLREQEIHKKLFFVRIVLFSSKLFAGENANQIICKENSEW